MTTSALITAQQLILAFLLSHSNSVYVARHTTIVWLGTACFFVPCVVCSVVRCYRNYCAPDSTTWSCSSWKLHRFFNFLSHRLLISWFLICVLLSSILVSGSLAELLHGVLFFRNRTWLSLQTLQKITSKWLVKRASAQTSSCTKSRLFSQHTPQCWTTKFCCTVNLLNFEKVPC